MVTTKTTEDCFWNSPYRSVKLPTYFPVYDRLFSKYIGTDLIFIEIGVFNGGSLFMWRDFFGPRARIIGIDLNPLALKWKDHGFDIRIASQSDKFFWTQLFEELGAVDIVLDDGGHTFEQQIVTTECCIPHIKNGGMLVVEDTHTSYFADFGGPSQYSFISYAKNYIDGINYRCNSFKEKHTSTNLVHSIRIFESIVVFEIERELCSTESKLINNGAETMDAKDFRYEDSNLVRNLDSISDKFMGFSMRIPYLSGVVSWLSDISRRISRRAVSVHRNRKLKKYFRF